MAEVPATWTHPALVSTRFQDVRWFPTIDSTNRYLLDEAARGAPEGVVAVADEQTAGRGRLGRSWVAPPGASLLVSTLLRPAVPVERRHLVVVAAALAAAEAVERVAGIDAGVKWPNDLVVADRKLAGILAESADDAVVVGMGLNVRWEAFPPEIAETATACNLEQDVPVDRGELLVAWLVAFDLRLDGLAGVTSEMRRRSATLGRRVRVELPGGSFEGIATDLDPAGHLVVERDDGSETVVAAGDVIHLRPAGG